PTYARAEAAALPFADASFDAAVACLVFEHIEDVDQAMAEVGRVLRPGGRFLFFLNHPLLQTPGSGWIDDQVLDPPEQYWRVGPYLQEDHSMEEVDKDVLIPFVHRPISRYVNAMAAAGLLVVRMEEPAPPPGFHKLRKGGARVRILFLDAADKVLVRRYENTRRRHPLSDEADRVSEGIGRERELLEPVKAEADVVIDTSDLNVHQLRDRMIDLFGHEDPTQALQTSVVSFGYKHGLPLDVDLV